jgi:hypothetical protein
LKISDFRFLILIGLIAANAFGFEAIMSIQPPLIQLNESATLSIEVRDAKNPQPPSLPDVPGLRFVSAGQSQQSTWINGKSDSFVAFNYTVYPQKTGTFSVGPFDYKVGNDIKKLGGQLKVVAGSENAQQAQSWSDLLFAVLTADRDSVYIQEPFELTLSVYSRQGVQLAGNIGLNGMPETGLSDLKWQEIAPSRDVVSNVVYDVRRFRTRTRALSSGEFAFAPVVTAQVAVPNQRNSRRDPFFNSFFDRVETRPVDLPVKKTVINVKALPETGKPSGFGGAVGTFDFQVSAQPRDIHPGDPVTLSLRISGNGNFDRIMMPAPSTNGLFRLFGDPVRKQEESAVEFEQVISPRTADAKEIPAIPFSFFDTTSGQYRTVSSAPIPIKVTATSNSTAQVFAAKESIVQPPPETPFATTSDLERIEGRLKIFWKAVRPWLWTLPAALAAILVIFAGRKFYRARQGNTAKVRRKKAPKAARKALYAAEHARRHGNVSAFYDSLRNALTDYFGHRLNLPPGDVTPTTVLQASSAAGLSPEHTDMLRAIFERIEVYRYGQSGTATFEDMEKLQNSLDRTLRQCEKLKF